MNAVLLIDFQNDFCVKGKALYVKNAENDVKNISNFLSKNRSKINYIGLTMDSHHVLDIAHPSFWQDKDGKNPNPFTLISYEDVQNGIWTPRFYPNEAVQYLKKLEEKNEFKHCIWPEHCIIGTEGAAIVTEVMNEVQEWCRRGNFHQVITKGTYPLTEHFGAFRANVEIAGRPETQISDELIKKLEEYQNIYFAGEAKSHCVANTLKQAMEYPTLAKKFVILEDCMSNVDGFEHIADPIYDAAKNMGIRFAKSTDIIL